MEILGELAVILALTLANGVFAGAEIAVVSLRRTRLLELVDSGNRSASRVKSLRDDPERFLATTQIGVTVVSVTAATFAGDRLEHQVQPWFEAVSFLAPYAQQLAFVLVVAVVSFLSLVLGELVPKSLALRSSERYALLVGPPLEWLSRLARPLVWFLTASSNVVLRLFGDRTTFTESRLSPQELEHLIEQATRSGSLAPRTGEIVSRALGFGELTAADVMVPRNRIVAIDRHASPREVQRVVLEEGHSRMPVYEDSIDNVVGYVSVKDMLALAWEGQLIVLEDLIRPAYFVPETMRAQDLLHELQQRRLSVAMIVDEAGGNSGLATIEDLVEELVGDIFSEHEEPPEASIVRQPDGSAMVQGTTPVRDVNRELDLDLPESDDYSTLSGLATTLLGRIPGRNEKLRLPSGQVLEVIDVTPRRVRLLRVHPPPVKETEGAE